MSCCVVLCCVVLCCVVLCCVVLCCVVLCCVVLRCAVLCCAVLCCVALLSVALRCVVLFCVALRCAVLCCVVLRCVALRCVIALFVILMLYSLIKTTLKGLSICFNMLKAALSGGYVNFGVFNLYGDEALNNALNMFVKLLYSVPRNDILVSVLYIVSFFGNRQEQRGSVWLARCLSPLS